MSDTQLPDVRSRALALINEGKPIKAALALLRPAVTATTDKVVDLPKPFALSDDQRRLILKAQEAIDLGAAATPTERRAMTDIEITALIQEQVVLATLADIVKKRTEAHKAAIFNHFDVKLEEVGPTEGLLKDETGHYLTDDSVMIPGYPVKFTREIRGGEAQLTSDALEAQIGEHFTREEFLSMTSPMRYVDEPKMALAIRKRPDVIDVIREAAKPATPVASFNKRKA
jgi:hypothetical protein